jgi:hypothetical protein
VPRVIRCYRLAGVLIALSAIGALAACGSSAATGSSSAAASGAVPAGVAHCGPAKARTLAADSRIRVYSYQGSVSACAAGAKRTYRLGGSRTCLRSDLVGTVAVAGGLAAYADERCGVDTGSTTVEVRQVASGRLQFTHQAGAVAGPESYTSVGSIVVRSNGALAWIAQSHSIVAHRNATEVLARAGSGVRILGQGAGIDPASLRLAGSRVSWRQSGTRRSATLS